MYGLFEANEKHYVKILNIEDNTSWSTPCLTLRCRGYIYNRSRQAEKGIALDNYTITVRVKGNLIGYVLNELCEGDTVFIIGHTAMGKCNGYVKRITIAEQIYKSEWHYYFKIGGDDNGTSFKEWGCD